MLGPRGSRLVHLSDVRVLDEDKVEVSLRELVGLQSERAAPLVLSRVDAADALPGRVAVLWPGSARPLRLDPLLVYRENEVADEVLFLNRDRNSRQVEYLSYLTGRTERDRSTAPALAALLSRVTGREVTTEVLKALAEQSAAETPSAEAIIGGAVAQGGEVGDFEILAELGRGGMGVVYLARQLSLGRLVALKMLPADLAEDEQALQRFQREVRVLSRLDHANVVKVLASGVQPGGSNYYAMELIAGCDLEQVWRELASPDEAAPSALGAGSWARAVEAAGRKRRDIVLGQCVKAAALIETADQDGGTGVASTQELADDAPGGYVRRVAALARDAARAVQAVHDQNVVHRDIKPANLMLTADGSRVVLMDFGLAKGQSRGISTQAGGLLGTLRYAAPEQLAVGRLTVGPAADVRALGVAFWELLTRRRLFEQAEDEKQLASLIYESDVPPLRTIDPGFDRDLEAIVLRATERRASDRIASAGKLADYLQLYIDGRPLPIRARGRVERLNRWALRHRAVLIPATAAALLVVVVAAIAWWLIEGSRAAADLAVTQRNRVAALRSELEAGLDRGDWSDAQLARLDRLAAELQVLSPGDSGEVGGRVDGRFAEAIGAAIRTSGLSPEEVARIRAETDRLAGRDASRAAELRRALSRTLGDWEPVFQRQSPIGDPGTLFEIQGYDLAAAPDGRLIRRDSPRPGGDPVVPTRISSSGSAQVELVFDRPPGPGEELGAVLGYIPGHVGRVLNSVISADGATLATTGIDHVIRLWNVADGRSKGRLAGHGAEVFGIGFAPDGRSLISGDTSGVVLLWDLARAQPPRRLADPTFSAFRCGFSADGRIAMTLFSTRGVDRVRRWDTGSGRELAPVELGALKMIHSEIDPTGRHVLIGSLDHVVHIWDLDAGREKSALKGHLDWVWGSAFNLDGSRVATSARDMTTRLWDVATGRQIAVLERREYVSGLAFAPAGGPLVGAANGHFILWDSTTGAEKARIPHTGFGTHLAIERSGATMAAVAWENTGAVELWDLARQKLRTTLRMKGYTLTIRSPVTPAAPTTGQAAAVAPAGGVLKGPTAAPALFLRIARDGVTLREGEVSPIEGPVRLVARRDRDRLSIQVNDQAPVEFRDLYPPEAEEGGVFALAWGGPAPLERLRGEVRAAAPEPNRLARGDASLQAGRYDEAIPFYEAQARSAAGTPTAREADCKRAHALIRLRRSDEAVALLEPIAGGDEAPWAALASWQLASLAVGRGRVSEAESLVEAIQARFSFEDLAVIVPAAERDALARALIPTRELDAIGMVWSNPKRTHRLERAVVVAEYLRASPTTLNQARNALLEAYRVDGRAADAHKLLHAANFFTSPEDGYRDTSYLTIGHAWICIELKDYDDALRVLDYLARGDHGVIVATYTALLCRARVYANLNRLSDAKRDIEDLFRRFPDGCSNTDETLFAYLVRGLLREQTGDAPGALAAWREGYRRAKGTPGMGMQSASILASLSGELTEDDVHAMVDQVIGSLATSFPPVALFKNRLMPFGELTKVFREMWRTPRGRDYARRIALLNISYLDFHRTQVLLSLAEAIHQGAFPGELSPERDTFIWTVVSYLLAEYGAGRLAPGDLVKALLAWNGTTNALGWQGLAPRLGERVRGHAAFIYGMRLRGLGRAADAVSLLRTARDATTLGDPVHDWSVDALNEVSAAAR